MVFFTKFSESQEQTIHLSACIFIVKDRKLLISAAGGDIVKRGRGTLRRFLTEQSHPLDKRQKKGVCAPVI